MDRYIYVVLYYRYYRTSDLFVMTLKMYVLLTCGTWNSTNCSSHLFSLLFSVYLRLVVVVLCSPFLSFLWFSVTLSIRVFSLLSQHFHQHHSSQFPTLSVCLSSGSHVRCLLQRHAGSPHTHTLPRGVRACYSDNAADKTNNRRIYKNGLKFHLILGDFHISAVLINPVFRHECRFRKTRGARRINSLNYDRRFWRRSSPQIAWVLFSGV